MTLMAAGWTKQDATSVPGPYDDAPASRAFITNSYVFDSLSRMLSMIVHGISESVNK